MDLKRTFAGAAMALAMAPIAAHAQAVGPTGGVVSINGGGVNGSVSANGLNGVVASGSGIGTNDYVNGFGNFSGIDAQRIEGQDMDLLGSVIANNAVINGNIIATSATNSAFSGAGVGSYNVIKNVGEVDQFTMNGIAAYVADQGIVQLNGVDVLKGDVEATSFQNSLVVDAGAGGSNFINNYGGYASITANLKGAAAGTFGSVFLTNTPVNSGNVVATGDASTILNSGAQGFANVYQTVGQVTKITYVNGPAP